MKSVNKKAAMEMSMGTIVTIVLLMSVLVLGLILIRSIFSSGINVVDATNDQLKDQVNKLFSAEKRLVVYPGTNEIKMKRGETSAIAIAVKNRIEGVTASQKFNYELLVDDSDVRRNCGITDREIHAWIRGRTGSGISLPPGDETTVEKILFDIPESAPLCSVKMRVTVDLVGSTATSYAQENFFLTIK